ncbi:nucleotide exchange factor GrpE [Chamaesiphon minutus]|uniref:Protein GrpE n=1 Tax=Chamaesiphon minutus (strain ATCC 27169 / PCC 6605) TaxID=1173020 RepID=K9UHX6_CHAP6|nr:nucleotide exchange factor GrpE [Chamaesiphon minutus]AFY93789.1 type II secretory pathway, ATPase PulE/Tfp pilus assembly pathway, ATPase PilB [Chamaesiphon minutus PCC 6605]
MNQIQSTPTEDNPIINLVDRILAKAIEDRASHLYFEPRDRSLQIRVRHNGLLQTALQNMPHNTIAPTIDRLKTLAQIHPERTAPQTGTFDRSSKIGRVQIAITTLPTQFGDTITAEITHIQRPQIALHQLIPDREVFEPISRIIHSHRGLILIVGARDSSTSAIVDASLAELQQSDRKIYTIDRQLTADIPGIDRILLPTAADPHTIAHTIDTCLHQQPDILAIGALDSLPVAQSAFQAVARGCLVFATISAATAGDAIANLIALGVPAAQLYTATIGIITQKSLKQLCKDCRLPEELDRLKLAQLGNTILSLTDRSCYYRANTLEPSAVERAKQVGKLCSQCQGAGYRGEIGIYEVLTIVDRLKPTILLGDAESIDLAAQETGMRSFLDLAIDLFRQGKIGFGEVQRCAPPKTLLQNQLANAQTYPDAEAIEIDNSESLAAALYWKQQALKAKSECEQLLAELEHYQQETDEFEQRIKQSRSQVEQGTRAEIALQLLSIFDVIELARTSIKPQTDREAAIQKGYSMLENKMLSSIKEIGVRVTESKGRKFEAHLHEVVREVITHEHPAGTVIDELKRGYTLGDRVLRLAQVNVAVASNYN